MIKSDVYIKLKYIRRSLDIYHQLPYHAQNQSKGKKNDISAMKTHPMSDNCQYLTCIKVSFLNQNLQNDMVTPRLQYVNDSCIIIHIHKTHLNYFCSQSNLICPSLLRKLQRNCTKECIQM